MSITFDEFVVNYGAVNEFGVWWVGDNIIKPWEGKKEVKILDLKGYLPGEQSKEHLKEPEQIYKEKFNAEYVHYEPNIGESKKFEEIMDKNYKRYDKNIRSWGQRKKNRLPREEIGSTYIPRDEWKKLNKGQPRKPRNRAKIDING